MKTGNLDERFKLGSKDKMVTLGLAGFGLLLVILSVLFGESGNRIWASFLFSNWYFLGLALGALVIIAINYLSNSGWSTVLKRIPEAMMSYLPIGAVLFAIPFLIYLWVNNHHHAIYHWMIAPDQLDALLQAKTGYLNLPFFTFRMIFVLVIWILFSIVFRRLSKKEDEIGTLKYYHRSNVFAPIFLFFFAITISISSWDWFMSLEPHWFSTIFGVYAFAGIFIGAWTVITMITVFLKSRGYLAGANENHLHDLGKFMFAFTIFWTYIWVSQFLLIWYANIPEETTYYFQRMNGPWRIIFWANLIVNFFIPFLALMMNTVKRNPKSLVIIGIIILAGRYIDVYLLTMPGALGPDSLPTFGFAEIGFFFLYGGIFAFTVLTALTKAALVPKNHPYLEESLHHEVLKL